MLPLLGRPLLSYTFDHLLSGGVERAILACGYLPTEIEAFFGSDYSGLGLEYRVEPEPLGTAGALRFAADGLDGSFLALNGDSLREAPLRELVDFHRERGAQATILLTPVEDVSRYGIVRTDPDGRVREFVEKPAPEEADTNLINAGVYVLEPEALAEVPPGRSVSIEREVFPVLAERGELFAVELGGYWLDVGTPHSFLQAHLDLLGRGSGVEIDPGADVAVGARIGSLVYVGRGASVGDGAELERTAVLPGGRVGPGERVVGALVAPGVGVLS
jgi:mannose-1-phosphate guanylyltransferase